jgi:hypothetical protein
MQTSFRPARWRGSVAASLFPWIILPAFPADPWLALWLIVKGNDGPLPARR